MIADQLARFAQQTCREESALQMMRLSVFDWAACGIAGRDEPVSKIVHDMVLSEGGAAQSSLLGGGTAPARQAALVNGVTSHALDYDDTHFAHIGHPSVAVVSAAFAVAEKTKATGDDFLQAALAGVEASVRVGVWLGRDHYQTGFHQTGTAGCFGAALASARLLGGPQEALCHALGLASTRAAGLKSQFGTMGKPYNAGAAASAGVEVAELACAGFISNPDGVDGVQGFGATHNGAGELVAFEGLGRTWLFEQISHKYHACCHGTHAMIEGLRSLQVDVGKVKQIEVQTHPRWLRVCDQPEPRSGLEAKFSYRLIAALVLSGHDTAALDSFSDRLALDPDLVRVRDKVRVVGNEAISETASEVRVQVAGKELSAQADIAAPLDLETRRTKLVRKAEALIGDRVHALQDAVLDAPSIQIDALGALLRQGD